MHSRNQRKHDSPLDPRHPMALAKPQGSATLNIMTDPQPKALRASRDHIRSPFSKVPYAVYPPKGSCGKPCLSVPVVSLEKMTCLGRAEGGHVRVNSSSSLSSAASVKPSLTFPVSHKSQERVPNGKGPSAQFERKPDRAPSPCDRRPGISPSTYDRRTGSSPSVSDRWPVPSNSVIDKRQQTPPSPMDRRPSAPPSLQDRKTQNGTKGHKPYKRLSGREFDPNKHCGVLDPESKRPCTRSLTCKTHSLTHRRAVPGRKKLFDTLLAEHKGRAKEKEKGCRQEQQGERDMPHSYGCLLPEPTPGEAANCHSGRSSLKTRLASLCVPRLAWGGGSTGLISCSGFPPAPTTAPVTNVEGGIRPSSDEGESEGPEEMEGCDWHCSLQHPRPLGCCAFGSRLMGRGYYVFDRRWDRLRLALCHMVERHVNSQMWKKIPLAADTPVPFPAHQPLPVPSPGPDFPPASSTSSLGMTPSPVPPLDSVSALSYPGTFTDTGSGMFGIVEPAALFPRCLGMEARAKANKASRLHEASKKKRVSGPTRSTSFSASPPHLIAPTTSSNGTTPVGAKPDPLARAELGVAAHVRHISTEVTVFHALPGGSTQPLHCTPGERRKRKSCSSYTKSGKVARLPGPNSIFRKTDGLLSTVPESPHTGLPRQPKLHH